MPKTLKLILFKTCGLILLFGDSMKVYVTEKQENQKESEWKFLAL